MTNLRAIGILLVCAAAGNARHVVFFDTSSGWTMGETHLKPLIQGKGYTYTHDMIGGCSSGCLLSNFDSHYAAWLASGTPNVIMVGTVPCIEPGYNFANLKANIRSLVTKIRDVGAVPIVGANVQPCGSYDMSLILDVYADIETLGVPVVAHFEGLHQVSSTEWIAALTSDGAHPSATGSLRLYEAIPSSIFDTAGTVSGTQNSGSWRLAANDSSTNPISVTLDRDTTSFTVAGWIKVGLSGSRTFASATKSGGSTWAISTSAGGYLQATATGAADIVSSVPVTNSGWHHFALAYGYQLNVLEFYLDGVLIGNSTPTQSAANQFVFGGLAGSSGSNSTGVTFGDLVVYRASLDPTAITRLATNLDVRRSREIWMPLDDLTGANRADTSVTATVNGSFTAQGVRSDVVPSSSGIRGAVGRGTQVR